ncbi:MAG: S-layer homology domain-containing protein [Bacillota bacterium]
MKSTVLKHICRILLFTVLVCVFLQGQALAYTVLGEAVYEEPVTAGVTFKEIRQDTTDGKLRVYVLVVDLRHPYIRVETLIGADSVSFGGTQTVREMAERAGAVAALNGDFFHLKEGKHPLGMTFQNGELLTSPMLRNDYHSFALLKDGSPAIDLFSFSGEVIAPNGLSFYPLGGINKPSYQAVVDGTPVNSDVDALQMYTTAWGPESRGVTPDLPDVVEVVVKNNAIEEIRINQPGTAIPADGYVLRAHGMAAAFILDNFQVGDPVNVRYNVQPYDKEVRSAVGGQALLVKDGRRVEPFSQNIRGKAARSAAGLSKDGRTLYLVGVEQSAGSRGMTQEELADFLAGRLGVWRAINLDGGGSTSVVARPLGETQPVMVNTPAKGSARRVPNALGVFSTAPKGELSGLVIRGQQEILAGIPYKYRAYGYDQYYNPYPVDAGKVVWQVEQGSGGFEGDVLTAGAGGTLQVTAKTGGAKGTITLRVIGPEDMAALEVSPEHIALEPGGQVKLIAQVRGKDGRQWALQPEYVNWEVQGDAGEIRNGVFYAEDGIAAGKIIARFNRLETAIPVEVAPGDQKYLWTEPEGTEAQEGRFEVRIVPGTFTERTGLRVENLAAPADLPEGYRYLDGLSLTPHRQPSAEAGCLLRWPLNGQAESKVVFMLRTKGNWVKQPAADSGDGYVTARVNGFGEIAVTLIESEQAEPTDIHEHWSRPAALSLHARGIMNGFPDGTFRPEAAVTRAQFAAILANAFGWHDSGEDALEFKDKIPAWAEPGIRAAAARGIVSGYPDGRFLPDKPITRTEMAVMIDRALKLGEGESPVFQDAGKVPGWAAAAVERAAAANIMQGAGGYFRPLATATRGETAALIKKALGYWTRW